MAPEMDKKMHIFASVDEADIGLIRRAQEEGRPVEFTVDAYPEDLFTGQIEQIRFSSTVTQNVVTYPVVVAAPNPELKLLPGMTADLSFQIEKKDDVLCVPNAALRYYPDVRTRARSGPKNPRGRGGGSPRGGRNRGALGEAIDRGGRQTQPPTRVGLGRRQAAGHPSRDGSQPTIDITEIKSGELTEGQKLVTGLKPPK